MKMPKLSNINPQRVEFKGNDRVLAHNSDALTSLYKKVGYVTLVYSGRAGNSEEVYVRYEGHPAFFDHPHYARNLDLVSRKQRIRSL